ncbi:MAG: DUF5615 family PIN-like protein [Oscillatoria sp. PMC 1068.18]|nr:DUF5615 family PIN-like protein [Oscillatoria sp. PMC 1076.18]MEC4991210.1 DUF5615 family PIN-like protein [Oscillatoria sp. PMC 1068.18]
MTLNYLLDENVNSLYQIQLQRQDLNIVVWRVGNPGAPPIETLDPEILCWCEDNNFILLTNNRKSMPVHLADHLATGRHVPGIFILSDKMSIGETIEELILVALLAATDEYSDQISYLPLL